MSIERLQEINRELQRPVTVPAAVLQAALREIKAQSALNGGGLLTRMVVNALEEALKK